jgi:hypothetical protein
MQRVESKIHAVIPHVCKYSTQAPESKKKSFPFIALLMFRIKVGLLTNRRFLRFHAGGNVNSKYKIVAFNALRSQALLRYEIIIIDDGYRPPTPEAHLYGLLRPHASDKSNPNPLDSGSYFVHRNAGHPPSELKPLLTKFSPYSVVQKTPKLSSEITKVPIVLEFNDFKKKYKRTNFPEVANSTENLVDIAYGNINRLRTYLRSENGCAVIRIKDDRNRRRRRPMRCILLPNTTKLYEKDFRAYLDGMIDQCLRTFPLEVKLFESRFFPFRNAAKRIPTGKGPEELEGYPLWKIDIMFRKWRTDRALAQWGEQFQSQPQVAKEKTSTRT